MATGTPARPSSRSAAATLAQASANATAKNPMASSGAFSTEQLSPDATAFPPLYEAAILYAADCYEAAQETLKDYVKTKDGKDSIRTWLTLFDLYQLTSNRKEFDALSMLFTVKFERSPPVWSDAGGSADPRRKEKRERKDFFPLMPDAEGALLGEIDKFEAFAKQLGTCRIGFEKVKKIHAEEAELFSLVLQRLRKSRIPLWFNGFNEFAAVLKQSINDASGQALDLSQGYWSLLFEIYILEGKLNEYEELGLEYAVAYEMSPPIWEVVLRPTGPDGTVPAPAGTPPLVPQQSGFEMKGVISATSQEMLKQLALYASSRQEVLVDMSGLMRIDFAMAGPFFESVRSIHLAQKRVILSNLNELVAALLEVFGMTKHAILMRRKAA